MLLSAYYKLYIDGLTQLIQSNLPHVNLSDKSYSVPSLDARVATAKIFGDIKTSQTGLRVDATKEHWVGMVHTRQNFQTLVGGGNTRVFQIATNRDTINRTLGCRDARQITFDLGVKFISNQPLYTDDILTYRLTTLHNLSSMKVTIDIDGVPHELSIQFEWLDVEVEDFVQDQETGNLYTVSWFTKVTAWIISPNKMDLPYVEDICARIWANYDGTLDIDHSALRSTIEINN